MCNLALLPKIALLRGPYDGPTDFNVTTAYLVDEAPGNGQTCVMYAEGEVIYFAQADKLRDDLYAESNHANTVDFFVDEEREPVAIIAEIVGKLRTMTALEFMRELIRIPGDHAIYYR